VSFNPIFACVNKLSEILRQNAVLTGAIILTFLVYYRFLLFGHISWDDPEMVFKNPYVQHFGINDLFTKHFVGNYIPVTMLFHALGWAVGGDSDALHHLINILFHLLNGILVFRLGKLIFRDNVVVLFGAIIFLLHPTQVESVGWISELKNVLSTTFYLSSAVIYLTSQNENSTLKYISSFLLFTLGCLSKSSVVVLPLSLICLELIINGRLNPRIILNKIPFLIVSVIIGIINIQSQIADQFINHAHEFPIYQRFGFAGFALFRYLILFLLPTNLSVIYPFPPAKSFVLIVGFTWLLILLTSLILFYRRKKFMWMGVILFILINYFLVLQFLPFGEVLYADRYSYVPLMAFGWIIGLFISALKIDVRIVGGIAAGLFALLTFARTSAWKDAITLYEDILKKYPDEFVALNSAGVECMFQNKDREALSYFDRAVNASPYNYKGFYNRGLLYLKNGRIVEAIFNFSQTIELYPYSKAYTGRASAFYRGNDLSKAMEDARKAIQLDPENSKAYFVLGNCYNDLNKHAEALEEYNKAIALKGDDPDYFFKRAIVKGKKQDFKACFDDLQIVIGLKPDYYEAYYWRGVAKVNLNQDPCEDLKIAAQHNFEPAVISYNKYCR
jgi:tetratricopeptide (TPR) repeat protein